MTEPAPHAASRVALITGAAGGLGGAVAARFADAGWRMALQGRAGHLPRLASDFPNAHVVAADLLDPEATADAVAQVLERWGRVDALVHLVGGFAMGSALDLTADGLEDQLDVNLRTAVNAVQAVLPAMLERGSGSVITVASRAAVHGGARMPAYAASKAALVAYARSLRAEVEPSGVGVSVLVPMGTIDTAANRSAMPDADPARWLDAAELADAAVFLAGRGPRGRVPYLEVHPSL